VAHAEHEQDERDDERGGRGDDHLGERGAARGRASGSGLREEEEHMHE
jgi:hypothetical protein